MKLILEAIKDLKKRSPKLWEQTNRLSKLLKKIEQWIWEE